MAEKNNLHPGTEEWRALDSELVHGPLFHPQVHTGDFFREVDRMAEEGASPDVIKSIIDGVINSHNGEAGAEDAMHAEFWREHNPQWELEPPEDQQHLTAA